MGKPNVRQLMTKEMKAVSIVLPHIPGQIPATTNIKSKAEHRLTKH